MSDIAIRAIAPSDHPQLCTLWRETYLHTYAGYLPPQILAAMLAEFAANEVAPMLPGRDETGLCAVVGQKVIGSMVFAERGHTAYLWAAYVLPGYQRLGAGSRLLQASAWRISRAVHLEIRVVPGIARADAFYIRHGFVKTGHERFELAPGHFYDGAVLRQTIAALRTGPRAITSGSGDTG